MKNSIILCFLLFCFGSTTYGQENSNIVGEYVMVEEGAEQAEKKFFLVNEKEVLIKSKASTLQRFIILKQEENKLSLVRVKTRETIDLNQNEFNENKVITAEYTLLNDHEIEIVFKSNIQSKEKIMLRKL